MNDRKAFILKWQSIEVLALNISDLRVWLNRQHFEHHHSNQEGNVEDTHQFNTKM